MSRALHAFIRQLTGMQQNIAQQLQTISENMAHCDSTPAIIHPEQAMARAHFLMHQWQQQTRLQQQHRHIKTQLKRFEKHQEKQQKHMQYREQIIQQNIDDEWIIQHREPYYEN